MAAPVTAIRLGDFDCIDTIHTQSCIVITRLDPVIRDFNGRLKDVDGRIKSGHDGF